jgi:hypothetical protein
LLVYIQNEDLAKNTIKLNVQNLHILFRALFGQQKDQCLFILLMKNSIASIITAIKTVKQDRNENEVYSDASVFKIIEVLLKIMGYIKNDELTDIPLKHLMQTKFEHLLIIHSEMKIALKSATEKKVSTEKFITFAQLEEKIIEKFGQNSKQYIIILLYKTMGARENFGGLVIKNELIQCTDKNINYLIIDDTGLVSIKLNNHKTKNHAGYNDIETMNENDSIIMKRYMSENSSDNLLFPEYENKKSNNLSDYITRMMKAIEIEGSGGITIIRKIIANSFPKDAALSVQKKNAKKLKHTLATELTAYRTST